MTEFIDFVGKLLFWICMALVEWRNKKPKDDLDFKIFAELEKKYPKTKTEPERYTRRRFILAKYGLSPVQIEYQINKTKAFKKEMDERNEN